MAGPLNLVHLISTSVTQGNVLQLPSLTIKFGLFEEDPCFSFFFEKVDKILQLKKTSKNTTTLHKHVWRRQNKTPDHYVWYNIRKPRKQQHKKKTTDEEKRASLNPTKESKL